MKHQNPAYNVSLADARIIEKYLNRVGFPVNEIVCNPNTLGQRTVSMVPEINIPKDGDAYNLEFRFQSVQAPIPVTQVRGILSERGLGGLALLYKTLWPNASRSGLDSRLLRVPEVRKAVDDAIAGIAGSAPEPVVEVEPPPPLPVVETEPPPPLPVHKKARRR